MIRLEVVEGQDKGRVLESRSDLLKIGRGEVNDFVVSEWHVSQEHAIVLFVGDRYVVRDLQATNGTRIHRGEGDSPAVVDVGAAENREVALENGDLLLLGDPDRAARVRVVIEDEEDDARIVSVRRVAEIDRLEADL